MKSKRNFGFNFNSTDERQKKDERQSLSNLMDSANIRDKMIQQLENCLVKVV